MEERKLNFKRNEDKTIVSLSDKKKEDVLKELNSLGFTSQELSSQIKKGVLEEGFKEVLLSLIDSHAASVCKDLGYDSVILKEREERFVEIRKLNEENRELRKQLGEKVSLEDVREKIKSLTETIKIWWNVEGFGHTSEIDFKSHGVEVKLSGMISRAYRSHFRDELSDEDKITSLKNKGFDIIKENICDTDNNRKLLYQMLTKQFPSAQILEIRSYHGVNSNEKGEFRDIKIFITNYEEIKYEEENSNI
jgi:hypothetical protein